MGAAAVASTSLTSGIVADDFGAWSYVHSRPHHLRGLVDRIWFFDGSMTCLRERTFPNGLLEIIVHLGPRYRIVEPRGTWLCPTMCLTGLHLGHLVVEAPVERTRVLGIRLTPAGAYALFARPMHELVNLTVDLEAMVGPWADRLVAACDAAMDRSDTSDTSDTKGAACVGAAVRWLEARLATDDRLAPAVGWMLDEIRRRDGAVAIGRLRERTGWAKARLNRVFGEQVGVSPKQYARVMRFARSLERINTQTLSLSAIASDAGYYDQPHMNAEFKELSGFTPTEFLSAHRYANSVSVAER